MQDKKVRIMVNAVAGRQGGGLRFLAPLLDKLPQHLPEAAITVYGATGLIEAITTNLCRKERIDLPQGISAKRIWWDQVRVRRLARRADLLLSPLNFGTLSPPCPQILFEQNSIYFDTEFLVTRSLLERAVLGSYRAVAFASMRSSVRTLVPSAAMKTLVTGRGDTRLDSTVRVVPHGYLPETAPTKAKLPEGSERWTASPLRLLCVSHPAPHKNIEALAHILGLVANKIPEAMLAVTFSDDQDAVVQGFVRRAQDLAVLDRISFLGKVPQQRMAALYRAASVVLYPSITESFGFPLLEALEATRPVVASDIPSNREIGGPGVSFHPIYDFERAADLVVAAGTKHLDPVTRAEQTAYVRRFDLDEYAARVAGTIREVLGNRIGT